MRGAPPLSSQSPRLVERSQDGRNDAVGFLQQLKVREPQHSVSTVREPLVSSAVLLDLPGVPVPVGLNDDSLLGTDEVHDERADWLLAAELVTAHLAGSEDAPEPTLSVRGDAAQLASTCEGC